MPASPDRTFCPGDIVRNFKRETVTDGSQRYLYRVLAFAKHTETDEDLVVYQALYPPFGTWCRPRAMFESEVDRAKYPDVRQRWRFEKVDACELAKATGPCGAGETGRADQQCRTAAEAAC